MRIESYLSKLVDCEGPPGYTECYLNYVTDEDHVHTEDLDYGDTITSQSWHQHTSPDKRDEDSSHTNNFELNPFFESGFLLEFDENTSREEFIKTIDEAMPALFSNAARAIYITMTVYAVNIDWWDHINLHFEYGVEDQVVLSWTTVPFKPHIYETPAERRYLWLDCVRLFVNITCSAICVYISFRDSKEKGWIKSAMGLVFEIGILGIYLAQFALLFSNTSTYEVISSTEYIDFGSLSKAFAT